MPLDEIFGELSPFEIVISVSGLIGGIFAIYSIVKARLLPARIRLKVADTVDVVIGTDGLVTSFHLACVFENQGAKSGVVQRMKAVIIDPEGDKFDFTWKLFFEYAPGGTQRLKTRDRHALAVKADDVEFAFVQFDQDDSRNFVRKAGEHTFRVCAWVNAESARSSPDAETCFRATVPDRLVRREGLSEGQTNYWTLSIGDWM